MREIKCSYGIDHYFIDDKNRTIITINDSTRGDGFIYGFDMDANNQIYELTKSIKLGKRYRLIKNYLQIFREMNGKFEYEFIEFGNKKFTNKTIKCYETNDKTNLYYPKD